MSKLCFSTASLQLQSTVSRVQLQTPAPQLSSQHWMKCFSGISHMEVADANAAYRQYKSTICCSGPAPLLKPKDFFSHDNQKGKTLNATTML